MEMITVNGVRLAYEIHGTGDIPLVMVHGSWIARRQWDPLIPHLGDSFRVVTYDRRGHSESERANGEGGVREHVADLATLIEYLGLAPAWVAGNSFGGSIALRLAGERPELLQGITVHEPPLFLLVANDSVAGPLVKKDMQTDAAVSERIASGDHAGAAEQFSEALGPGTWTRFPTDIRQTMIENAPAFLEDWKDPEFYALNLERINHFPHPALLTQGNQSPPQYALVITRLADVLPTAEISSFAEAGHIPHMESPKDYAEEITTFVRRHTT